MKNDNIENIIKKIPEIIDKSKHTLSKIHVYGESGSGLVKVKMNSQKKIIKLFIDKAIVKEGKFIIEDLVIEAINNANKKIDIEVNNEMIRIINKMGIPNHFITMLPFINK